MSFKELVKKVEASKEFKTFKKENPKSVLYSAFFLMRQAAGNLILENQQLDFWLGNASKSGDFGHAKNKDVFEQEDVASFAFDGEKIQIKKDQLEPAHDKKDRSFRELDKNISIDTEDVKKIILKELEKNNFEVKDVSKIILVLQEKEKTQVWNITCIISLSMLRIHIDMKGKVLECKKSSLFDMMRVEKGKKK